MKIDQNVMLVGGLIIGIGLLSVFKSQSPIYDIMKPICDTVELPFLCMSKAEAQRIIDEVDAQKAMYAGGYY